MVLEERCSGFHVGRKPCAGDASICRLRMSGTPGELGIRVIGNHRDHCPVVRRDILSRSRLWLIYDNTKKNKKRYRMVKKVFSLYEQYYIDRDNENLGQFTILADKFNVETALYPGSFVHITPSLVFPSVTYIDTDKRAKTFFNNPEVYDYIDRHKIYTERSSIVFIPEDYRKSPQDISEEYDLLISLYAGFVSKYCTQYLRVDGLLLVNNSHGDASMASIQNNLKLIGIFNRRNQKYSYSEYNLDSYLIPKKDMVITEEYLESVGRGIGYTKSPISYLFTKVAT